MAERLSGGRADLHIHSTVSDGTEKPGELIRAAAEAGLDCISLCDHDAQAPWNLVRRAAREVGICAIAGIELGLYLSGKDQDRAAISSSEKLDRGEIHILGYGASADAGPLGEMLRENRRDRHRRMGEMIERLRGLGIDLGDEDMQLVGGCPSSPGRPHLARALLRAGHVESIAEAFAEYLAPGKPAYVPRRRVSVEEGIDGVIRGGGLPFLAHPCYYDQPLDLIDHLQSMGIAGVEVLHKDHSMGQVRELLAHVRRRNLLPSGGSDYHGRAEDPRLGDISVPTAWAKDILGCHDEMSVLHDNRDG